MQAYYEMSRRTFTDNVINPAIKSCLIYDFPDILTPTQGLEQCRTYKPRGMPVVPSAQSRLVPASASDHTAGASWLFETPVK
ncbi:hypothetical protein TOPH_09214 [Tolypocladium ophioglossoides CBS 100239]|uniref:Uncharacterized protein n=1 Tax=Tolypocladium ophioglossoides (strain CBS 100239) TaxID=1163406 RepID=A0A0L0MXG8_TOLOC|nr:hypothetical protein TOPH_09214 [Tolypocladium ophioglossoides CBS 100239]